MDGVLDRISKALKPTPKESKYQALDAKEMSNVVTSASSPPAAAPPKQTMKDKDEKKIVPIPVEQWGPLGNRKKRVMYLHINHRKAMERISELNQILSRTASTPNGDARYYALKLLWMCENVVDIFESLANTSFDDIFSMILQSCIVHKRSAHLWYPLTCAHCTAMEQSSTVERKCRHWSCKWELVPKEGRKDEYSNVLVSTCLACANQPTYRCTVSTISLVSSIVRIYMDRRVSSETLSCLSCTQKLILGSNTPLVDALGKQVQERKTCRPCAGTGYVDRFEQCKICFATGGTDDHSCRCCKGKKILWLGERDCTCVPIEDEPPKKEEESPLVSPEPKSDYFLMGFQ